MSITFLNTTLVLTMTTPYYNWKGPIRFSGPMLDSTGAPGTDGQAMTASGGNAKWQNVAVPTPSVNTPPAAPYTLQLSDANNSGICFERCYHICRNTIT